MNKFILNSKRKNESGNILIYILGAIFLLGLLVVISKGSVTPGAGVDHETLMIRVAEVQDYGKELERAVSYVLANGHSEVDIRFAHPDAASAYGVITSIPSRQIFSRDGGGATYREPPDGIQTTATDWVFNGSNQIIDTGSSCGDIKCTELLALLPYVTKDFCLSINNRNNIQNITGAPPTDSNDAEIATIFTGDYTYIHNIADTAQYLKGTSEGCFEGGTNPPAGTYHYYRVILAR